MGYASFGYGRAFMVRADYDSDLIEYITEIAKKEQIETENFIAIGALKSAKLAFYDQQKYVYSEIFLASPREIASCLGERFHEK